MPTQVRSLSLAHQRRVPFFGSFVVLKQKLAEFVSPALVRSARRKEKGDKYKERKLAQQERAVRQIGRKREGDALAVAKVFA